MVGSEEGEVNLLDLVFGVWVGGGGEAENASFVEETENEELVGAVREERELGSAEGARDQNLTLKYA